MIEAIRITERIWKATAAKSRTNGGLQAASRLRLPWAKQRLAACDQGLEAGFCEVLSSFIALIKACFLISSKWQRKTRNEKGKLAAARFKSQLLSFFVSRIFSSFLDYFLRLCCCASSVGVLYKERKPKKGKQKNQKDQKREACQLERFGITESRCE